MSLLSSVMQRLRTVLVADTETPGGATPTDGATLNAFRVAGSFNAVRFSIKHATSGTPGLTVRPVWYDLQSDGSKAWFHDPTDIKSYTTAGNFTFDTPRRGSRCWLMVTAIDTGGNASAVIDYALVKTRYP